MSHESRWRFRPDFGSNSPLMAMERVNRFFRRRFHFNTAEHVAAALDVPVETARNWLRGRNALSADHFWTAVQVWGLDFIVAAYPDHMPAFLDAERAETERARLESEMRTLEMRLAAARAAERGE